MCCGGPIFIEPAVNTTTKSESMLTSLKPAYTSLSSFRVLLLVLNTFWTFFFLRFPEVWGKLGWPLLGNHDVIPTSIFSLSLRVSF